MDALTRILACFLLYGLLGWLLMTIVHTVRTGRLVSAGFLRGPFCPAFGLTAALLLLLEPSLSSWPPTLFIAGTLLTLAMDVLGAWIMLVLFRVRWWPDTPGGLRMVTAWLVKAMAAGLLGSLLIYVIHPHVRLLLTALPAHIISIATTAGMGILLLDSLYSLDVLDKLVMRLRRLHVELGKLGRLQAEGQSWDMASLHAQREAGGLEPEELSALAEVDALTALWRPGYRLMMALPHLHPEGLAGEAAMLRGAWMGEGADREGGLRQAIRAVKERFALRRAAEAAPFARGNGFYKLMWVFTVACVLGFLMETVFALVTRGVLESRTGMVYGPFNQIYGLGAVLMVVLLHPLARKKGHWLFLAGALLGGVYEFVCSWVQELMFGTISWDYTHNATSIGGRTSLSLMLWWGVLAVVFIKGIYPRLSALIERIPRRPGVALTWIITIMLALNLAISAVAVGRWVGRQQDAPPQTALERFVDTNFPDKTMERIYPSMKLVVEAE